MSEYIYSIEAKEVNKTFAKKKTETKAESKPKKNEPAAENKPKKENTPHGGNSKK